MRGTDTFIENSLTMRHLKNFVSGDHPIRLMVNQALVKMDSPGVGMYKPEIKGSRPSKYSLVIVTDSHRPSRALSKTKAAAPDKFTTDKRDYL